MAHLTHLFDNLVLHLGFVGLFLVVVLGNLGMPAALEVMVPFAGGLAAQGHLPAVAGVPAWIVVAIVATVAELVGMAILYTIGWYGGTPFVHRYGKYVRFSEHELARVHGFYQRYGRPTAFVCRFVPFVRGVAALPAGIARMQRRSFFGYSALGSLLFCFGLAYLGNVAGQNLDAILAALHKAALLIVILVVIAIAAAIAILRARAKKKAGAADVAI